MYEQFKLRAEAVSAEVHRFAEKPAALDFIINFLREEGVADTPKAYALWADSSFLHGIDLPSRREVPGLRFEVTRDLAAAAKFGISQAAWALADTGSLVLDSTAVEGRLVSTLTDIHIALLPTSAILPDMPTLLTRMHPDNSSYIAMITGPSRTADIERVLTIGVHGPSRLIIVCVDELEGAN